MSFESGFRYPFERLSWNWNFKVDLDTHLTDKHGHLFLWDLELFWTSFKVCQTKVQNMHFFLLSWNWVLKVDLGTHLRDKHAHLFLEIWSYFGPCWRLVKPRLKLCTLVEFLKILWDLKLFWPSFKVVQTKVEKVDVCWLSQNWALKVDLGNHLRDKHGHLFLWDLELFWPSFKVGQTKIENMHFSTFSELIFVSGFRYPFET